MNILLLTSAMVDNHFSIYQERARIKPNPSNQNFYSKLIRALSIDNNVAVVTQRPFVKGMFGEKSLHYEKYIFGKTTYYYSNVQSGTIYKILSESADLLKTAKTAIEDFKSNDFVIIVDTLKYHLLKTALKLAKIYKVKCIGMLTDNPYNLSDNSKKRAGILTKNAKKCFGYLSLTRTLADNLNHEKPAYIFEGLVQNESSAKKDPLSGYFFFGGSLYERYGVKKLVDAFHGSNCKSKLIIAGNGPLSKYIDRIANDDLRILYLPQISKEKVVSYEMNAIANINPRPLTKLDKESVPSKLLEYLSTGVPTISTKYPKFVDIFKDDVYWIESEQATSLAYALEEFEKLDQAEMKRKALVAKDKVFEFYGLKVQGESIAHFLKTL